MEAVEFEPFENILVKRVKELQEFTQMTRNAIHETTGMPRLVKVLARTNKKHEAEIEPAEQLAAVAKTEIESGFATLHGINVVLLWGALESTIRDFLVVWLTKYPEARQITEIAKLKVRIGDYDILDFEDRMRYVLGLLERENGSALRPGIARFTQLLHFVGIVPKIDDKTKNTLLEMASVRNVIVHRAGIVDQRFLDLCPSSGWPLGGEIGVTSKQLNDYVSSIADFVESIVNAVEEVEYFRPDHETDKNDSERSED